MNFSRLDPHPEVMHCLDSSPTRPTHGVCEESTDSQVPVSSTLRAQHAAPRPARPEIAALVHAAVREEQQHLRVPARPLPEHLSERLWMNGAGTVQLGDEEPRRVEVLDASHKV